MSHVLSDRTKEDSLREHTFSMDEAREKPNRISIRKLSNVSRELGIMLIFQALEVVTFEKPEKHLFRPVKS